MAARSPLLRGLGILFKAVLVIFVAVFFYAYWTGGQGTVLTLFGNDNVGVLLLEGSIDDSIEAVRQLRRFNEMTGIKAVVVRIDSPGGAVAPTQEIHEEIEKLKKKKPVIASLGSIAASGGYYVASACSTIVANPGTLTGSIGVIVQLANVEELMKKLGVKQTSVKSGPHKDIGSPVRSLSPEDKAILQSLVDNVHEQFVRAVAKGRGIPEVKVRAIADGRVYSGEQAKGIGLVDQLGNMEDAIEIAAKRAGISGKPQVIYAEGKEDSWWRSFIGTFLSMAWEKRRPWGLRYEWALGEWDSGTHGFTR